MSQSKVQATKLSVGGGSEGFVKQGIRFSDVIFLYKSQNEGMTVFVSQIPESK